MGGRFVLASTRAAEALEITLAVRSRRRKEAPFRALTRLRMVGRRSAEPCVCGLLTCLFGGTRTARWEPRPTCFFLRELRALRGGPSLSYRPAAISSKVLRKQLASVWSGFLAGALVRRP